jgi:hypothetical protein
MIEFNDPPFKGAEIRAEGEASPTGCAQVTTQDLLFECLEASVYFFPGFHFM